MKDTWDALSRCPEQKTVSNKVYTLMQLYGLCKERGTHTGTPASVELSI